MSVQITLSEDGLDVLARGGKPLDRALGVALVGQIFFSQLATNFAAGNGPQAAFGDAAALAMWYQVVSFGLVLALAFVFKGNSRMAAGQDGARPVIAEA